jgi:hypothetical protein
MGRKALGSAVAKLAFSAEFFVGTAALGQPAPEPVRPEGPPLETPAPDAERAPAPAPARSDPPPLDPPPPTEPTKPPGFLRNPRELEDVKPRLVARSRAGTANPDFLTRASPWVDFSFTSFYLDERVGNFVNFGVQVGGYFFEHLRLSGRLVAPTEEVRDGLRNASSSFSSFDGNGASGFFTNGAPSRSMSLLYGASAGLVLSNDRSFVFAPSLGFLRTDVGDYGTAVVLGLPFEWTTGRNLRVGFELAIGRASGGTSRMSCTAFNSGTTQSCGVESAARQGGTAVLLSYTMGWALGRL